MAAGLMLPHFCERNMRGVEERGSYQFEGIPMAAAAASPTLQGQGLSPSCAEQSSFITPIS